MDFRGWIPHSHVVVSVRNTTDGAYVTWIRYPDAVQFESLPENKGAQGHAVRAPKFPLQVELPKRFNVDVNHSDFACAFVSTLLTDCVWPKRDWRWESHVDTSQGRRSLTCVSCLEV